MKDKIWFENAEILLKAQNHSSTGVQLLDSHGYNLDISQYTNAYIVLSVNDTDITNRSYLITKAHKFGNLQIYCYMDNINETNGL